MRFTKMHGLGNDYVFVDLFRERVEDPSALAWRISDRHTGVGSDGLILIAPSKRADVRMIVYNADGSSARMCGNGLRCVARYAVEHGLAPGPELTIETDAGLRQACCRMQDGRVAAVRVGMGVPSLRAVDLPARVEADSLVDHPVEAAGRSYRVTCVSIGNPHAVVFVDDLDAVMLDREGPALERHPWFPDRINVHFVRVESADRLRMRTWERGSGATRACGSGACAVCVAGVVTGRSGRRVTVRLPGGELKVEWPEDAGSVYLTGPAEEVFTGDWPEGAGRL
ncbi:MAG: diaminopimelate epimerase [Planctomycetota bacterium]|nr:MAG: diaminopimelate epimerase [Planctomycetota bacterium]